MTTHLVTRLMGLVIAAGCLAPPRHVTATFPSAASGGEIEVVLDHPTRALTITVNDRLVIERQHAAFARIRNVPLGPATVRVVSSGPCEEPQQYDGEIEVIPGEPAAIIVPGGVPTAGCTVLVGLLMIAVKIGFVAMAIVGP